MTDDELKARVAIADRLGACAQAGDARKADAYAECFTEDGVLALDQEIKGREAIRAWMAGPSVIEQPKDRAPGFISHHITSSRVEITSAGIAKGRTYFLVTSTAGIDHNGYYDDNFRREGDTWLIAHRHPRTLWISPTSVLHGR